MRNKTITSCLLDLSVGVPLLLTTEGVVPPADVDTLAGLSIRLDVVTES